MIFRQARRLAAAAVTAALLACGNETSPPTATERSTIAVEYVSADALNVHARPADDAPVIAQYANGESVSVLSRRNKWSEVRTATGSGWVHADDLSSAVEAKKTEADNLTPRFRVAPLPVMHPGLRGEIRLEAGVNTDGEVTDVRVVSNTTGSEELARQNAAALRHARFVPIVQHGERKQFTYDYHVQY